MTTTTTTMMMKKLRLPLLLLLLLLLMVSMLRPTAEAAPPPEYLVNRNCSAKCGNVVVPFPFGIGENCYLNEWYSVECRNASGSGAGKPFLKHTKLNQLELLRVSLEYQTVTVKSPIASYDQQVTGRSNSRWQSSMNLEDTPFMFSRFDNIFMVLGCGHANLMDNGKTLAGCSSICSNIDNDTGADSGCYGINCCQNSISTEENYYLKTYNLGFTPEDDQGILKNTNSTPVYAFLVDYSLYRNFTEPEDVGGVKYAPLSLFWVLEKGEFNATSGCDGAPYRLTSSGSYSSSYCSCPFPYEGNPFLSHGCDHVVKECANCLKTCDIDGQRFNNETSEYDNHYYCRKKDWKERLKALILGVSIGGGSLLLLFGSFGLYKVVKEQKEIRRRRRFFKRNGGLLLEQQISSDEVSIDKAKIFAFKDLEKATDNFNLDRVLGQGGQGKVYKGMLTDGKIIAVKKSMVIDRSQIEQFINEIVILSQINHRNIVRLLGCCLETEVPLLVYEFIPNGTLFHYIHNQDTDFPLSWEKRLRIAIEVAEALFYLHSACSIPIYHRDVKSTNILLDDKYRAKVSDFGTSRSISIDQTHLTTHVQGTFGYLDPEYFQSNHFTEKSDVYSFGVVLAELLTGQKPICFSRPEEEKSLVTHFNLAMEESRLYGILDAVVANEGGEEEIKAIADLAHRCLNMKRKKRPTMKEVSVELECIKALSFPSVMKVEQDLEENASMVMGLTESLDGGASSSTRSCLHPRITSSEEQQLFFNTI